MTEMTKYKTPMILGAAVVVALIAYGFWASTAKADLEFTDVRAQAREFAGYYQSIQLTPEQEAVKKEALSAIPAPCCSDNSMYTCCCPCNMAKVVWGLSNHLIADKGYDATQVRKTVQEWLAFINPEGFSGDVCYTGRCNLPWAKGGCGGMGAEIVF
jgi:hypothetical protein